MKLHSILTRNRSIKTDIGDFNYVKFLGEGANSFVFQFDNKNKKFAIKFLKPADEFKLKRFKDEYFCTTQIHSHKNIARIYNFDKIKIEENEYFIIIMKLYEKNLKQEGPINIAEIKEKSENGWKLYLCLKNALDHLHSNNIIHRDIKPENIFFDSSTNQYVIGDLGIAHFENGKFPKQSETKPSERMANFNFSAPEQINSKVEAKASCDIYSMGQVLYWYLTGNIVRGLGCKSVSTDNSPDHLKYLDKIIKKCLMNSPEERFQSISEINDYEKSLKKLESHDYMPALDLFDDSIVRSIPKIKRNAEVNDIKIINKFFDNFKKCCNPEDYWYMDLRGGDNTLKGIEHISNSIYLFCDIFEINISKLLIHRDSNHAYNNFFIILLDPSLPFDLVDDKGISIEREIHQDSIQDEGTLWKGRYIDCAEIVNGYYEFKGETLKIDSESFKHRIRHLKKYAYIVVPKGTATARMMDRSPTTRFLGRVVNAGTIEENSLKIYQNETQRYHSCEITKYD